MGESYFRFLKPCYEAGELVMAARPYIFCVIPKKCRLYCAHCLTAGDLPNVSDGGGGVTLSPCEGCGWDHYCGARCQQAAWSAVHRHECALLRAWTESGREREKLSRKVRMLLRVVLFENDERRLRATAAAGGDSPQPPDLCDRVEDPGWRRSHEQQLSHRDDIALRPDLYGPVLDGLAAFCAASADVAAAIPPLGDLLETYGRFRTNWYDIRDARDDYVALGLYLSPSLFNHSCLPSLAYTTTDGMRIEFRALRRIDTATEPLTSNYLCERRVWPVRERRCYFAEDYFFECGCTRCDGTPAALARDRRLRSARCVLGDECRKLPSCEHCESVKDGSDAGAAATELDAIRDAAAEAVLQRLRAAAARSEWALVVEAARRYLLDDGASLGVCNARAVRVRERLVAACHELADEWRLGVEQGLILLDVYLSVCPEAVVYIGKLRLMIGTMMLRGGRSFADAARQLSQAAETLRITWGPDHPLTVKSRRLHTIATAENAAASGAAALGRPLPPNRPDLKS